VIRRIAAAFGILAAAAIVAAAAWVTWPLPSRRGTTTIAGLSAPVEVRFDRQGVPHIRTVLETDAWRALGWLHAADRLFQMELRRRAATGRLAEVFGPAGVPTDREARQLGYVALARRDWDAAGPSERAILGAYVDGINAYLADHPVPLEVAALGCAPEPWTPVDALAFARLMQDGLTIAASRERGLFDDARARGLAAAVGLFDASESGTTRVAPEVAEFLAAHASAGAPVAAEALPERAPAGSNAWAVTGARSASRRPLLAGDPHLNAERPGVWYAAHLTSADGLDVAGLTLPGGPGVLIGHNGRVAWSITMNQADDADLFLERIDAAAGTVLRDGRWEPLARSSETIHVKGADDVVLDVRRTAHGPIVVRFDDAPGYALARASAPEGRTQGIEPFVSADRARDGRELRAAFSRYAGPAINVCWADAGGNIGVQVAGAIPARRDGDGRFPVPGWTGAYDWNGTIEPAALPSITNPPDGFVASANDDWSVNGAPLPYPGLYASNDRAGRARQLAGALHAATVADMRSMQADVYSPYAARAIASMATMTFSDARARRAVAILTAWDARASLRGPSRLFYAFLKQLRSAVAAPLARGTSGAWITWSLLDRMLAESAGSAYWDDPATPRVETRQEVVERALASALEAVEREDGRDPARWNWGRVHRIAYPHPFASVLPAPIAKRLSFGPVGLPGEWNTLDVAGFSLRGDRYDVVHIPSARLVVDLGDPDASRLVLPLGQSGQLFDRHARDQLTAWSKVVDFPLPFTAKAVTEATTSTLRFVPAD
jgi:penicillin G amidase